MVFVLLLSYTTAFVFSTFHSIRKKYGILKKCYLIFLTFFFFSFWAVTVQRFVYICFVVVFMCMSTILFTVEKSYVHGIGQDYSFWTLQLTLQNIRCFLLYTSSCSHWIRQRLLNPWPRTLDFIALHNSASKQNQQTTTDLFLLQYFDPMTADMGK